MKFSCERDVLLKEISIAQEIISSRNSLSILSNVLLEASDNTLLIRATDLKVGFETKVPVDVAIPGSTTVFCDKFLGILRALPEGEVEFEQVEGDNLVIRTRFKKIDFKLKCIPADKFPEIQIVTEDQYFEFPQNEVLEMISQTVFAVSDDETRYFMNGVYLEREEADVVMVATDGRRLAYVKKPAGNASDFSGVIVPPKILMLIKRLASGEGSISLAVTEKSLYVKFDNQKISSSLIEGQFPNYRRVVPENQLHSLVVKKSELIEALKRVSLLVEQKSRRIYLSISQDLIEVSSEESDFGVAHEEIPCEYQGPEMKIAMNYLYLIDPLKVIEAEDIQIRFTESTKALTLDAIPVKDYFHIVMPMQID